MSRHPLDDLAVVLGAVAGRPRNGIDQTRKSADAKPADAKHPSSGNNNQVEDLLTRNVPALCVRGLPNGHGRWLVCSCIAPVPTELGGNMHSSNSASSPRVDTRKQPQKGPNYLCIENIAGPLLSMASFLEPFLSLLGFEDSQASAWQEPLLRMMVLKWRVSGLPSQGAFTSASRRN